MADPFNRHAVKSNYTKLEPSSASRSSRTQLPSSGLPANSSLRSRYDQPPLASGSTGYASSVSHLHTSVAAYSDMEVEGRGNNLLDRDDAESVYSYNTTGDVNQFVRELHGRIFNALSESYHLPTDQVEWARLDKQASAISIAFDGLYPCPDIVEAVLLPEAGQTKRIVDIGCGTGAWALQMAAKFPHASVLGVDIAPTPIDQTLFPPNLSFEIDDITLGLGHFAGKIDLVHMRCVTGGIPDMDKTLQDLQLCLKPGGLLIVVDGDKGILREDRMGFIPLMRVPGDGGPEVTEVSEQGSWLWRLFWEGCEANELAGACITRSMELLDHGLWDHPLCDPETARSGGVDLPVGPWAKSEDPQETQLLQYVGVLARQNFFGVHRAYHAILLKHGMPQETLDEWSSHIDEELKSMRLKMWMRFRFVMARRRAGEGLPAPPLPTLAPTSPDPQLGVDRDLLTDGHAQGRQADRPRYPASEVFYTKEENSQWMLRLHSTLGVFPIPVVKKAWERMQAGS